MKTSEKITFLSILVAGLVLAGLGYFLFFMDQGPTELPELIDEPVTSQEEKPEGPTIISDIEGDHGVDFEEAVPVQEEPDVGAFLGTVINAENEPVEGATVSLFRSKNTGRLMISYHSRGKPIYQVETDAKGAFQFAPLYTGGGYRLIVDHPRYKQEIQDSLTVKNETDETRLAPIQLTRGKEVSGKVRDEKGKPISGATVGIIDPTINPYKQEEGVIPTVMVLTDEEGSYYIPNVGGTDFKIRASAPGFETKIVRNTEHFTDKRGFEFIFYLARAKSLQGVVVDVLDRPIQDAQVRAILTNAKGRTISLCRTDKEGRFLVDGLSDTSYYLLATHPEFSSKGLDNIQSSRTMDVVFKLKQKSGISGQVVTSKGKPVRSFWINVRRTSPPPNAWAKKEFKKKFSHKDGLFIIDYLEPGKYVLEVAANDFAPVESKELKVKRMQYTSDIQLTLLEGGSLSGTILDSNGRPLSRVKVSLRSKAYKPNPIEQLFGSMRTISFKSTRTNSQGQYQMKNVIPGEYQLEFESKKHPNLLVGGIQVMDGQHTPVGSQAMEVGASLFGRVFNDANSPVGGAKINIRTENQTHFFSTTADNQGFYRFDYLPPGIYSIIPMGREKETDQVFDQLPSMLDSEITGVELFKGENKELTLIIYS